MRWTGAELLANPGEVIDVIVAAQVEAVMARLAATAKPEELAELRRLNLAKAIEWRETVRVSILAGLRNMGLPLPDDFGALSDCERALLSAEVVGSA